MIIIDLFNKFINSSFFRFGILVSITYVMELIIFIFLLSFIEIFWSNFIASFIGVTLDYLISLTKRLNIFKIEKGKKFINYIIYIFFIFILITFSSYLIEVINEIINRPVISKLIIIPLSYIINWSFLRFVLSTK